MEQAYKQSDVFITHTWRPDLYGRDNHERVSIINEQLNRMGFTTWFDSQRLEGRIREKMAEGVDFTRCVIVFVTEEYMKKIDSRIEADDCLYEFNRALIQKTPSNMLCVVMEEKYENPANWFGELKNRLGNSLFVSMFGNLKDKKYLNEKLQEIAEQLKLKDVVPSQTKNRCDNCMIITRDGHQQSFLCDGDYCTYCSATLQKTIEPKNYCVGCNMYSNGSYCALCKGELVGRNRRILQIEEQYIGALSLEENYDISEYDVHSFEKRIQTVKVELEKLQSQRDELQTSGVDLKIKNEEYENNLKTLQMTLATTSESTSSYKSQIDLCSQFLRPSYEDEVLRLEEKMRTLEMKRKEFDERFDYFSQAEENLKQLEDQVSKFRDDAVEKDASENKRILESINSQPRQYLESLIVGDEIEKIETSTELKKEIMEMKDEGGFNLLMSLAVQHGTIEMINLLIESGIEVSTVNNRNETHLHQDLNPDVAYFLCQKYGHTLLPMKDADGLTSFMKAYRNAEILKPFVHEPLEEMSDVKKMYKDILND